MEKESKDGVSVIVCCYNSAKRLPPTLEHLARQKTNDINWELILVNNASTDNTEQVAKEYRENLDFKVPFKIVYEKEPGLMRAREKGRNEASYNFLCFVDDDNWLDSNYVQLAYDIMASDKNIGALGGFGTAVFESTEPPWFKKVQGNYAVGKQAEKSGEVTGKRNTLYGAGIIIRNSAYLDLLQNGFKAVTTGRKGNKLTAGEDDELCLSLKLRGYKIWYDERLKFKHYIEKNRLTDAYFKKMRLGSEISGFYNRLYLRVLTTDISFKNFFWLRELLYTIWLIAKAFFDPNFPDFKEKVRFIKLRIRFIGFLLIENFHYDEVFRSILNLKK